MQGTFRLELPEIHINILLDKGGGLEGADPGLLPEHVKAFAAQSAHVTAVA